MSSGSCYCDASSTMVANLGARRSLEHFSWHIIAATIQAGQRNSSSTLLPGSGSFQLPDLAGFGYGLGVWVVFTIIVSLTLTLTLIITQTVILP